MASYLAEAAAAAAAAEDAVCIQWATRRCDKTSGADGRI